MGFGVAAIGQLSSFDHAGMQPSERPLQFGTCRKGNSHNSALAAIGPSVGLGRLNPRAISGQS